jgi:quercetin dioxygenase-like cupin family protein
MSTEAPVGSAESARRVELHGSRMVYLLTGKESKGCSLFEIDVAPGFDTGAHYHTKMEEFVYVLDGTLEVHSADRVIHATAGSFIFVSPGTAHSIANRGAERARLLLGCFPSGHEHYFDGLAEILAQPGPPDADAIGALRSKHDTIQLSALKSPREAPAAPG